MVAEARSDTASALGLTGLRLLSAVLGVAGNALLARGLGPAQFGLLAAFLSVDGLTNVIAEWATTPYLIRRLHEHGFPETPDSLAVIQTVATARLITGPLVTGIGCLIAIVAIPTSRTTAAIVALAIWLPSLLYSLTTLSVRFLAARKDATYALSTQFGGILWSLVAIWVGLSHWNIRAVAVSYCVTTLAAVGFMSLVARRRGFAVRPSLPSAQAVPDALALLRDELPHAWAQLRTVASWRALPLLLVSTQGTLAGGQLVAGLKYWEQVSLPVTSLAQFQVQRAAAAGPRGSRRLIRRQVLTALAVGGAAIPVSFVYVRLILGSGYGALRSWLPAGIGLGITAAVLMGAPPMLIAGRDLPTLRRLGSGGAAGIGIGVAVAWGLHDRLTVGQLLAVLSASATIGLLVGIRHRLGLYLTVGVSSTVFGAVLLSALLARG